MKFVLNGCDISFVAEAPASITLDKLIKQCDRIVPDWCACGICSLESRGLSSDTAPQLIICYDDVIKTKEDVSCTIKARQHERKEIIC